MASLTDFVSHRCPLSTRTTFRLHANIALFDVASRQILASGPAYTSAVLSPSGKLVAVEHERKIRLYRVD